MILPRKFHPDQSTNFSVILHTIIQSNNQQKNKTIVLSFDCDGDKSGNTITNINLLTHVAQSTY